MHYFDLGRRPYGGHPIFLQGSRLRNALCVVGEVFIQRAADLLDHRTGGLSREDHWIQHHAVIRHHPNFFDVEATSLDIDLHQCRGRTARVSRIKLRAAERVRGPVHLRMSIGMGGLQQRRIRIGQDDFGARFEIGGIGDFSKRAARIPTGPKYLAVLDLEFRLRTLQQHRRPRQHSGPHDLRRIHDCPNAIHRATT